MVLITCVFVFRLVLRFKSLRVEPVSVEGAIICKDKIVVAALLKAKYYRPLPHRVKGMVSRNAENS